MPHLVVIHRTNKLGGSVSNLPEMTGLPSRFKARILDPSQLDRAASRRLIPHDDGGIQPIFSSA
jgi:hypothetical protein